MPNDRVSRRSGPRRRLAACPASLRWFLCLAVSLAAVVLRPAPASATVIVNAWGTPQTQTFDHNNPPSDLPAGENADAAPSVSWSGGATHGTWDPSTSTYTVSSLDDITLTDHTTIRLPDNADDKLKGHENGHDRLSKAEYDRLAKEKVDDALNGLVGMKFTGAGATDADRQQDAKNKAAAERNKRMKRAIDSIVEQMDKLNNKYDDLTDHGSSSTVDTPTGEKKAKDEQAKAPKAGSAPAKPDSSKESGQSHSMRTFFNDTTQALA